MSLLVVGSVAFDTVETPFGSRDEALGGSALYFSTAASYFADVRMVGVVGQDFPDAPVEFLRSRDIDISGLHQAEGKTFRWTGKYGYDLNEAVTLDTQLNVFGDFRPELSDDYRDSDYVFLANIDPELQLEVLDQVRDPEFVALDTMNFWIEGKLDELKRTLSHVDMVVINEGEARELSGESNMVKAARAIRSLGPRYCVIKRGEYGALSFVDDDIFFAPAYPLEDVFDPTGAGDTFAGGMLGYLSRAESINPQTLRLATVHGCVMASFVVENFSFDAMRDLTEQRISDRLNSFRELVMFDHLGEL
jgi:sugar/nucleoside kinase (ribokinase family)